MANFARAAMCALVSVASTAVDAHAALYRCLSSDCSIETSANPLAFHDRSWTLFINAHPGPDFGSGAPLAGLFTQPGVLEIGASGAAVQARVFRGRESAALSAPVAASPNERLLIALSWNKALGELHLYARAGGGPVEQRVESPPGWADGALGANTCAEDIDGDGVVGPSDELALLATYGPCPAAGACPADIDGDGVVGPLDQIALLAAYGPCPGGTARVAGSTIGAAPGDFPTGFIGDIGPVILRAGAITPADFSAIADDNALLACVFLDTTAAGGALSGVSGALFAMAHGAPPAIGKPITNDSVLQFDRLSGGDFLSRAPSVVITGSWLHVSPYDEHGYARSPLPVQLAEPPFSARPAPLLRQIATGAFTRQIRALVHGNSRVARVSWDNGVSQSYAHGWEQNRSNDVVGWLLRPPRSPVDSGAWWGFNHWPAPPVQTGTVDLSTTDFSRFGQNSVTVRDLGPGTVSGLLLGGLFRGLAEPEPGMRAGEPMRAGAVLLQYPGSGNALVQAVRASAIDSPTVALGATTPVWLDTERFRYTFAAGDTFATRVLPHYLTGRAIDKTALRIPVASAASVQPGDAVYGALAGAHSVSVVESITDQGDGTAEILLATKLAGDPQPGDVLHFGPWAFTWIELDQPPDADNPWRGTQVVSAGGGGDGPVVLLGFTAYVPDKPGMVLTTFGAGGDGYRDHLEDEIPGAARRMAETLGVDAALMTPAQQNSTLDDMERYVAQLRLGRPDVEIALLGDGAFNPTSAPGGEAASFFTFWDAGFLARAPALGAVAVDGSRGARLGRFLDRVADGQMSDAAHQSSRGAARQAEEWDRLLAIAAMPKAGDVDGDGAVGPTDLLLALGSWGVCPQRALSVCPADFDRDGVVGPSDLLAMLAAWGR